jgi:hypothetical protein
VEAARTVLILVTLLAARLAVAVGPPCEEGRPRTGLALSSSETGLTVAAVDDDSAAGASGVRVGDRVLQVNGVVPRGCADYARAVRDAEHERKALLLLVGRRDGEVPLALAGRTWDRPVAAVPPPPAREPPSVQAVIAKPPPETLPTEVQVTLDGVLQRLEDLAPPEKPPARLSAYQHEVLRLHREIETLAARKAVPAPVADGLRTVLRYHDAAEVAWTAEETQREDERRPRHLPIPEAASAPFFADSEAASTIEEFPFLREAVSRDPKPSFGGESSGQWRPTQARTLLWNRARAELAKLRGWLANRSP